MNVLIAEDEPAAAKRMTKLLAELDPAIRVAGMTETVKETVAWLNANDRPDLAFFDVRLADGDSFQVFRETEVGCPVIFTTAYDAYAIEAFRVQALDYLLKPLRKEDLAEALRRAKDLRSVRDHSALARPDALAGDRPAAPVRRFLIRYGDHLKVVGAEDIAYFHSQEKNTFLRTLEGRDLPFDESLDRLEKQLDPEKFFRINRQVIIHFQSIKELLAYSKSRVKVLMEPPFGEDAIVSSERSAEFKRWLSGQ